MMFDAKAASLKQFCSSSMKICKCETMLSFLGFIIFTPSSKLNYFFRDCCSDFCVIYFKHNTISFRVVSNLLILIYVN